MIGRVPEAGGGADAEPAAAMRARVRGVGAEAGEAAPFAVMQATLTALYDRPGIRH